MDDDLEDEVFLHTLISHIKIVSKCVINFPVNIASFCSLSRLVKMFSPLVKVEYLFVLAAAVLLVGFFCCCCDSWYKSVTGKSYFFEHFPKLGSIAQFFNISNASALLSAQNTWQFKEGNIAVYAVQGRRPRMEDRFSVMFDEKNQIYLMGIFDGHGGDSAAEFVKQRLLKNILSKMQDAKKKFLEKKDTKESEAENSDNENSTKDSLNDIFSKILTQEIVALDEKLVGLARAVNDVAGTTALIAVIHEDELLVANVGDSRGVITDSKGFPMPLSFDHKPQQVKEYKRIKKAGGFITFNGVWRVAGILATSRAMGDFPLKDRNLIIAEPDILSFNIAEIQSPFLILATDGLWDMFSNEDAVTYVKQNFNDNYFGAKNIAMQAYSIGSLDNITVLVVNLKGILSKKND